MVISKNKKNKICIKKEFKKNWKIISKNFKIAIVIFMITIILGIIFRISYIDKSIDLIKNYAEELKNKSFFKISSFIFFNNLKVSLLLILLGITFFIPTIIIIFNGFIVGTAIRNSFSSSKFEFLKLIPHGIFEISALAIAYSLGFEVIKDIVKIKKIILDYKKKNKKIKQKEIKTILLKYSLLILIIVILLAIAAIIETITFKFF